MGSVMDRKRGDKMKGKGWISWFGFEQERGVEMGVSAGLEDG